MKSNVVPRDPALKIQLLLRIKHPALDPAEITQQLKITPEHTANVGSTVSTSGRQRLHTESYWLATLPTPSIQDMVSWGKTFGTQTDSPSKPEPVKFARLAQSVGLYDVHLILWLDNLAAHRDFIKRINNEGGSVTLVLQRPNRSAPSTVSPSLARQLGDLDICLEID